MLTPLESILSRMTQTFGKRLDDALRHAKRERQELADAIGISVQAIAQVIAGKTKALTAENTAKAARYLKVDWFWLATGEGSPGDHETTGRDDSTWPFPRIDPARFDQLSANQKLGIEDAVLRQVEAFLGQPTPSKSTSRKNAA